jgi:cysteinyl-tRNA synthetase
MLRFYNTYSNKLENFKPIKKGEVRMYTCGPTVYMHIHLGNARTFLLEDLLRRYLEYLNFKVKQVMNITDVGHLSEDDIEAGEDKIQKMAKKKKVTPKEIADFYEKDFYEQIKKLNIEKAYKYPRATDHIKEMQSMIKKLIKKKHAYEVNGSVYFDISSFKNYGKLSGNTVKYLAEGKSGRTLKNKDKKNFYDFSLWIKDDEHLMNWSSPWCKKGYPNWHLECSVMSIKYLGEHFDIHMGGEDNIFPHHEAEIAQAEGATGKKWVNYWMHTRHLMVEGAKMSKRDGNFYTPEDIYNRGFTPRQLRFFLISSHYRKKLNFTFDAFESSNKSLQKISTFIDDLQNANGKGSKVETLIKKAKNGFEKAMDDDLNISGALASIFGLVTEVNKKKNLISKAEAKKVLNLLKKFDKVLGVIFLKERNDFPADVKKLIKQRDEARKNKDWTTSDKIRDDLLARGIELHDTDGKTKVVVKFKVK